MSPSDAPVSAVCTHGLGNRTDQIRILYDAATDQYWARFQTSADERRAGLLMVTSAETALAYHWADQTGGLAFPIEDPGSGFSLRLFVYQDDLHTSDPDLENGTLRQLWTFHRGEAHVVHQVTVDQDEYLLYRETQHPISGEWLSYLSFSIHDGDHGLRLQMGWFLSTGSFDSTGLAGRCD